MFVGLLIWNGNVTTCSSFLLLIAMPLLLVASIAHLDWQ